MASLALIVWMSVDKVSDLFGSCALPSHSIDIDIVIDIVIGIVSCHCPCPVLLVDNPEPQCPISNLPPPLPAKCADRHIFLSYHSTASWFPIFGSSLSIIQLKQIIIAVESYPPTCQAAEVGPRFPSSSRSFQWNSTHR